MAKGIKVKKTKKSGYRADIIQNNEETVLVTGKFINRRDSGACYVHIEFANGGSSNFVLRRPGDKHSLHLRTSRPYDQACWSDEGRINDCEGDSFNVKGNKTYLLVD